MRKLKVRPGSITAVVVALAVLSALVGTSIAQSQLQPGYAPQPQSQEAPHQTLTLPQVGSPPPATMEIPSSQGGNVGTLEVPNRGQAGTLEAPTVNRPQTAVGRISITATDGRGQWIQDLQKQDLTLYEDGIQRPVLGVQRDTDTPITIGIVVDTSGSMEWKLAAAEAALQHFVRTLNPRDQFFLIAFSNRPFLLQGFTDNPAALNRAIALLHAYGQTALFDAVVTALRKVEEGRWPKKALLVMTDGMDNVSSYTLEDTIQAARRAGVLIYTVGLGTTTGGSGFGIAIGPLMIGPGGVGALGGDDERVDAATLRTLSDETGATTFVMNPRVTDMSRLDQHFQSISAELRDQYTVRYASAGGDRPHQIRVDGTRPGMEVRAPKWAGTGDTEYGG
jgi:Ca-activated chloride channel homolog